MKIQEYLISSVKFSGVFFILFVFVCMINVIEMPTLSEIVLVTLAATLSYSLGYKVGYNTSKKSFVNCLLFSIVLFFIISVVSLVFIFIKKIIYVDTIINLYSIVTQTLFITITPSTLGYFNSNNK